jgi:hypothetical protein
MTNQVRHWQRRAAQRGISRETLDWIRRYGEDFYDGRHGYCEMLGRRQVDSMLRDHPELKGKIERYKGKMIVSDSSTDNCRTVKHVYARVRRDCQSESRRRRRRRRRYVG